MLEAAAAEQQEIIFGDPRTKALLDLAERFARSDAAILITGPSGVGKERFAHFIHDRSPRVKKRFVAINCAAIPENLLESELFGYERGAFTGAVSRRIGKFEEAHGSTLLLDEISEMDSRLQAKLLRVIQEKEIDRLGGKKPVPVNVRLIATSNRNLQQSVQEGQFREDLFFRLNVINLDIPPLRERSGDILKLAESFVAKFAAANGKKLGGLSDEASQKLLDYSWPGNVRELENAIHRAVLLTQGEIIEAESLIFKAISAQAARALDNVLDSAAAHSTPDGDPDRVDATRTAAPRTLADIERDAVLQTLDHCVGDHSKAAKILGISIQTLNRKLQAYAQNQSAEFMSARRSF